jgi:hypothetical protein
MFMRMEEIKNEQVYLVQFAEQNGIEEMAFRKK